MVLKLNERITLTDEHSASSYGQPVAIIGGAVYGPGDRVGGAGHAREVVQADAIAARLHGRITTDEIEWCSKFWRF